MHKKDIKKKRKSKRIGINGERKIGECTNVEMEAEVYLSS